MTEQAALPRVQDLTEQECLHLLAAHSTGRVAFEATDGPMVLPVSYVWWEGKIAFRTSADGALSPLAARTRVAFQIDSLDSPDRAAWSVLVRGTSRQVRSAMPMVELLQNPRLVPWMDGPRRLVIAIEPDAITGRRLMAP